MIPEKTDSRVFVTNQSSIDMVEQRFLPLIEEVKQAYLSHFADELIGVYLEGSVGRGSYVDGVSDCDFEAVIGRAVGEPDWQYLKQIKQQLRKKYDWLSKLDMEVISQSELSTRLIPQFRLATDSVLLQGNPAKLDVDIPPIGLELARFLNQRAGRLVERARDVLNDRNLDEWYLGDRSRWIAKIMLRLSLGLAMTREPVYTPNVGEMSVVITKAFPELAGIVNPLDEIRLKPAKTLQQYKQLLQQFELLYEQAKTAGISD